MSEPQIQLVSSIADTEAMSAFFMQVWADGPEVVPFDLALAVQHVGGYSAVAKIDGNIVGASFGFQGSLDDQRILHSHVTAATVPGAGFALKLHQKQWAAEQGIDAITWTFDPLVRRNAVFNFEKLGAVGIEYLPNFYGTMTDAINAGDESDRLFTYWPISAAALKLFGSQSVVQAGEPGSGVDLPLSLIHISEPTRR
jgi:predicted GNAT superfamily acetyltransferase